MRNWTREWLRHARVTKDAEGDLVVFMQRDRSLPPLLPSSHALISHLKRKGAGPQLVAAAPAVYRRYARYIEKHPFEEDRDEGDA